MFSFSWAVYLGSDKVFRILWQILNENVVQINICSSVLKSVEDSLEILTIILYFAEGKTIVVFFNIAVQFKCRSPLATNIIKLIGRWRSDAMKTHLCTTTFDLSRDYAARMLAMGGH